MAESDYINTQIAKRAEYLREEEELTIRAKKLRAAIDGITAVLVLEGVSPIDPSSVSTGPATAQQIIVAGLTPAIREVVKSFAKPFTAPQILDTLHKSHPALVSTDRAASVSGALRRLAVEKFIFISAKGAGRRPTKYRYRANGHDQGKEAIK